MKQLYDFDSSKQLETVNSDYDYPIYKEPQFKGLESIKDS